MSRPRFAPSPLGWGCSLREPPPAECSPWDRQCSRQVALSPRPCFTHGGSACAASNGCSPYYCRSSSRSSPVFPISVARRAEVDPGMRVEWPVMLLGAAALIVAVIAWSLVIAWRQSLPRQPSASARPPVLLRATRFLSPAAAVGCATVIAPSRRAVRAGTALVGTVVAVTAVVAIMVFSSSHHAALADPSNYGWTWTSAPDVYGDDTDALVAAIAEDPRIEAVGGRFCSDLILEAQPHPVCAIRVVSGSLNLRISDGRSPTRADEIALGMSTMHDLSTAIGGTIELPAQDGSPQTFQVVGQVVMAPIDVELPGVGAAVTEDGLAQLSGSPQGERQTLLLRYRQGVDAAELERSLEERFTVEFTAYSRPSPPERLVQLDRMRPTLVAVAVFLGALGVIGLMHYLALSSRRRRGELAVLRALGFVRSQVRASLSWQAMTVTVIGLTVGVPIGVLIGRRVWTSAIDQLGMVASPTVPLALGIGAAAASVLGAAVVGNLTGLRRGDDSSTKTLRPE